MRRLTVAVSAALCLMGTSSLALAEEGTKYGDQMEPTGKLSQEPSVLGNKREPVRADDAVKREPVPDDAMKVREGSATHVFWRGGSIWGSNGADG